MSNILKIAGAGVSAAAEETDENFNQTVLLLHGDGTNGAQNNTFIDSSTNSFTITRNGNTTQGTFSPFSAPDGRWSNYFDGTSDNLSVANNAAFQFGTGDFTVEAWIYQTVQRAEAQVIVKCAADFTWNTGWAIALSTNGSIVTFWVNGSNVLTSDASTVTLNGWSHVAVSRSGTTLKMFINGVEVDSDTNSTSIVPTVALTVGADITSSTFEFQGYLSNVRVVKGTALYTGAFTPSTTPLTAVSGTSLLTCQSNRFVDNSTNNFAITRNGDVKVTPFSPFAPTAAYDASVNGGSGYFDGSGDYLNTPSSGQFAPTGDFTVAWWYYPTTLQTTVMIANYTGNNATDWSFETDSTGDFNVYLDGSTQRITGSTVIKLNQWNYLVVSRSGTTVTAYCNGSSVGTHTLSGTFGSASKAIRIGGGSAGTNNMFGYCAGVSLIDGTALDGTIPTAPPTDVSGTELLCNFTNAGIFDNTGKNNLETVNAQIDTTVKKFGTGSMEFDGTGDYLTLPASQDLAFGTGDFTVEGWLYLSGNQNFGTMFLSSKTGLGDALHIQINDSNKIRVTNETTQFVLATNAISLSTWTHIAVVRSGSTLTIYQDGVANGSTTNTTNFIQNGGVIGYEMVGGNFYFNGLIDDLRITKGVARYTTTFTPPTKAFPDL